LEQQRWVCRLKGIALWWTSIVVVLFALEAGVFTYQANKGTYLTDNELKQQYLFMMRDKVEEQMDELRCRSLDINVNTPDGANAVHELEMEAKQIQDAGYQSINAMLSTGNSYKAAPAVAPQVQQTVEESSVETEIQENNNQPDEY
jgi:hypothetical protein